MVFNRFMLKVPVDCANGASRGRIREGGGGFVLLTLRSRWRRLFDIVKSIILFY